MKKTTMIDANAVKSIAVKAAECGVPERWLRGRVAAGEVSSVRIGWNVFIADTETAKIRELAANRTER